MIEHGQDLQFHRLTKEELDIVQRALHAYRFEYWQRVDIKQPDKSGWYAVWFPHGTNRQYECIDKAYFESSTGHWRWNREPITHWNFMPSPPRGDEMEPF